MDERSFFDNLAVTWDDNEILSTPEKVNYILDFLEIKPSQKILDLGTGTGVLLPFLCERVGKVGKVTAVDYSAGMLAKAIEKFSGLSPVPEFLNLDIESDVIEGEYDRIILYCVYPHLHTPVDTLKWLRKVNLSQNGSIFICFPCSEKFINDIHREKHSESDRLFSPEELSRFLNGENLKAEVISDSPEAYIVKVS